jgi:DNA invertase Pin-like site-specific DNA recombinase
MQRNIGKTLNEPTWSIQKQAPSAVLPLIPAAQYLRMSTEHQQYSIHNQRAAIQVYADAHGFHVIQTYADSAKSGVVLKRRDGLRQLLQDVMSSEPGYRVILVYDISRWGRFQDVDESAHYEFLCKTAGVPVHYCAEIFANDLSLPNMLMKAIKRTMAGEYSRELGVKVFAGLKRLARLGFKQGGMPGYGLRRMLLSVDGDPKQLLAFGERKSIATERVILVPGPAQEVQCVREIYRLWIDDRLSTRAIADELNGRGIEYHGGRKWKHLAVYAILTHPKYMGCNVYGRTAGKLYTPVISLPESEWTVTPGAFTPIIDSVTFQQAQRIMQDRTQYKSNEEILGGLRALLAREGRLTLALIEKCPSVPSPSGYRWRFGSVRKAYELIGYGPTEFRFVELRRKTQAIRHEIIRSLQEMFPTEITIVVRPNKRWRSHIRLKSGVTVNVLIGRCRGTIDNRLKWEITAVEHESHYVTLIALLNPTNTAVHEMFVLPNVEPELRRRFLTTDHPWLKRGERLKSLSQLLEVVHEFHQEW